MNNYNKLSACKVTDGIKHEWGISWTDTYGTSGCFIVGSQDKTIKKLFNEIQNNPANWVSISELDGSFHYFNVDKSVLIPSNQFRFSTPGVYLCIQTDSAFTECIRVTEKTFDEKSVLFKRA